MTRRQPLGMSEWTRETKRRLAITNTAIQRVRGLTKGEIARLFGFQSQSTITNWEKLDNSNMPHGYYAYLYSIHFDVSPDWLFAGNPNRLPVDLWREIERLYEESE